MFAIKSSKSLRTVPNMFVFNLAVVELFFCVLILPAMGAHFADLAMADGVCLQQWPDPSKGFRHRLEW